MGEFAQSCEGDEAVREVDVGGFLPREALRVLLVEADDSTRHVIAALLRKCGYKVATVSDGLKAWEVLKGKPSSVDLILTEVELPSIAGFALLTLIMEHDSCKSIPVIMMSSNDSVNMVYKCMLRGAADFLVKPVRKNELQNLWQHVWRRKSQKGEGLSGSDLPINLSSGACTPENDDCNEKGNDVQSSCSVPELEAESAYFETKLGNSKGKFNKLASCNAESCEEEYLVGNVSAIKPTCVHIRSGSSFEAPEDAVMKMLQQEDPGGEKHGDDRSTGCEASDNNDAIVNGSREAIDLIGNFKDHSTSSCINSSVITSSTKFEFCPQLDLSLRRYDDSRSKQQITVDERSHAVHQSDASAFSRYISVPSLQSTQTNTCHQPMDFGASSDKQISSPVQPSNFESTAELRTGETSVNCAQARTLPITVSVKRVRLDHACPSNGSSLHPSYYQMGTSPNRSPDSAGSREAFPRVMHANASSCNNQTMVRQEMNFATTEHTRNVSSPNEKSQNSSLCNGSLTRLNSSGGGGSACGSNGSGNNANITTECKADGVSMQEENINRSLQREAALTKFRQKRKDRCFEKKVRYESRKKLAEQRPRVKGQFVRQVPIDVPAVTTAEAQ